MFADQRRALRLFRQHGLRALWLAWLADRTADWVVLLVLLVATWNFEGGWAAAAWVLAAWFAPRLLLTALVSEAVRWPPRNWPLMSLAKALLLTLFVGAGAVGILPGFALEIGAAALLGLAAALASQARLAALTGAVGLGDLGASVLAASFVERVAVAIGGAVAFVLLLIVVPGVALVASAVVYFVVAALILSAHRSRIARQATNEKTAATS